MIYKHKFKLPLRTKANSSLYRPNSA